MDQTELEILSERGPDGTLRRYYVVPTKIYVETLCSSEPCSTWFTPRNGGVDRFCSSACRMREHRAGKRQAEAQTPGTGDSRAPG